MNKFSSGLTGPRLLPSMFSHALAASLLTGACSLLATLCPSGDALAKDAATKSSTEVTRGQAYWIFFTDKGVDASSRSSALAKRLSELPTRARKRRGKVRSQDALVDTDDLPVALTYRSNVLSTGAIFRVESRWLNAISVRATPEQLEQIRLLPNVDRIAPVASFHRRPIAPWQIEDAAPPIGSDKRWAIDYGKSKAQLETMNAPDAHECGLTGKGVIVGILDSGFQTAHSGLKNVKVIAAYDFVQDDDTVSNEGNDTSSQHNHGTSCLSLIAANEPGEYVGGAPDVEVVLAKTEDVANEFEGEEDYYIAGLEFVEENGADIATSSLGYSDWVQPGDFDGKTRPSSVAVGKAVERGLICLTATGNDGPGEKSLGVPADAIGVLSIGATDVSGKLASFSSRGPTADGRIKPEFVAPGATVYVANASGGYNTGSGTSYATPLAAAMTALLLQSDPTLTPAQVFERYKETAKLDGQPANNYGWGLIDIAKATEVYCNCTDADKDGYPAMDCGGTDCDDDNPDIHPGADEDCDAAGDENCNGLADEKDDACEDTTTSDSTSETSQTSETSSTEETTQGTSDPGETSDSSTDSASTATDDSSTSSEANSNSAENSQSTSDASSGGNGEEVQSASCSCSSASGWTSGSLMATIGLLFGFGRSRRRRS